MKITVKYTKEEKKSSPEPDKLKDVEIDATDFYLAIRRYKEVVDKESKVLYKIPIVNSLSTNGGSFREIIKEIRQGLKEIDGS